MSLNVKFDSAKFDRLVDGISSKFDRIANSKQMKEQIGELIISDIQKQTRAGNSIPDGSKFPGLKPSTVKMRDKLSDTNQTGEAFSVRRSNLTLSGQLLLSLKAKLLNKAVEVEPSGIHRPYRYQRKDGSFSTVGRPIQNKLLSKFVADQGRDFIGVRDQVRNRIGLLVRQQVRREFGA